MHKASQNPTFAVQETRKQEVIPPPALELVLLKDASIIFSSIHGWSKCQSAI